MRPFLLFLVLFAALSLRADDLINADRPGIADGITTVGHGVFQLETGVDHDRDGNAFPTLLRYGLGTAFELRVESESALTHPLFGFKYHFANSPSLGIIVRAGQQHDGDVRLTSDINLGEKWSLNPNIGIDRERNPLAAMTVQYNLSDHANVFIDSGYDSGSVLVDAGGAIILGRDTQLDVSVTRAVRGDRPLPNTVVSAGISRRF